MVMGIFEVEGNHIVAWRDYYDVRNAEKWATSYGQDFNSRLQKDCSDETCACSNSRHNVFDGRLVSDVRHA
jgi:Limonene-1,2-epoxide hydrolase catalytic domain